MVNNYNAVENSEHYHKYWIDCLKLAACFLVFWGHFSEVFIYKNDCFANYEGFVRLIMKSVLNGNFWVAVFCIISGYCISSKRINTFTDLIRYYIKRYLRFVLPLFLTLFFVVFLGIVVQYRTGEFPTLLQGTWGGTTQKQIFHLKSILNLYFCLVIH